MKLSVILVSVNIAATLPIAAAGSAFASEESHSDKADWLKSSLVSLDTSVNQKKSARARKLSYSQPTQDASGSIVLAGSGVKMRPFVPNRKLPTQHELDVQFIAQSAKMAKEQPAPALQAMTPQMAPGPLTGQVSEVYGGDLSRSSAVETYGSVGYVKQSSSRVIPGQVPAVPGQIRQFRSSKKTRYIQEPVHPAAESEERAPALSMPSSQQTAFSAAGTPGSLLQQQPSFQSAPVFHAPVMQPFSAPQAMMPPRGDLSAPPRNPATLGISAEEQSIIDSMVSQTQPRSREGAGIDPSMSMGGGMPPASAGPPPFPLNLLPQDSLKQIIGGMRQRRTAVAPSYFGSWRGNSLVGGFHTYARRASYRHAPPRGGVHPASRPAAHSAVHPAALAVARHQSESTHTIAQLRRLPPHEYKVATYPAYARYSSSSAVAY